MYPAYESDIDCIVLSESCRITKVEAIDGDVEKIRIVSGVGDYKIALSHLDKLSPTDYKTHYILLRRNRLAFKIIFNNGK